MPFTHSGSGGDQAKKEIARSALAVVSLFAAQNYRGDLRGRRPPPLLWRETLVATAWPAAHGGLLTFAIG
jgi:hypothetical protein